jgi:uncharacterized protein YoxC
METFAGFETWFFGSLISILLIVIGFFLKRNLEKLENKVDGHEAKLNEHETKIQVLKSTETGINRTLERTNELLNRLQYGK